MVLRGKHVVSSCFFWFQDLGSLICGARAVAPLCSTARRTMPVDTVHVYFLFLGCSSTGLLCRMDVH